MWKRIGPDIVAECVYVFFVGWQFSDCMFCVVFVFSLIALFILDFTRLIFFSAPESVFQVRPKTSDIVYIMCGKRCFVIRIILN